MPWNHGNICSWFQGKNVSRSAAIFEFLIAHSAMRTFCHCTCYAHEALKLSICEVLNLRRGLRQKSRLLVISYEIGREDGLDHSRIDKLSRYRQEPGFSPSSKVQINPDFLKSDPEGCIHSLANTEAPVRFSGCFEQLDSHRGAIFTELFANKLASGSPHQ